jgi:hypothetical protein
VSGRDGLGIGEQAGSGLSGANEVAALAVATERIKELEASVTKLEDTVANVIRIACAASNDAERDLRESGLL